MKFIVLYFFRAEGHISFYQEARKIYNNQPLAGISSILSLFPPAAAPPADLTPPEIGDHDNAGLCRSHNERRARLEFNAMLKIYNSLSRAAEAFVPFDPARVRMYVCGITVYDFCHLGHARMMIAFDIVQRWLRASGYPLIYVRNITDIDDKIIRRAAETGEPVRALTERFIRYLDEDAARLAVQKPDIEPRATGHVAEMLEMVRRLEERGIAYRAESGDVNFSVRKFPGYGKLSGKSLDDLRAGERVEVDTTKRDPLDFVLWKRAKEGEPFWHSPWGNGRPGWHIECSAMSTKLLGAHFDIHGGGQDLQFPHHENA